MSKRGEMDQEILRIEALRKVFRKHILWHTEEVKALNNVSFRVNTSKVFGLVGESGCGKTTTARCIAGLERLTCGKIWFQGDEIGHLGPKEFKPYRRRLQMVFQDPSDSLNPRYTVRSAIREPLDIHTRMSRADKEDKLKQILELVGLRSQHLSRYPHQLSTGQQQRVGIARAVVSEPELVLLDEPTSSLDISVQGRVLELFLDLQDRFGMTYLLISHDLGTVHFICHETAVMYLGSIVEIGDTRGLFKEPLHPYTKMLTGARPRLRARAARQRKRVLIKGEVPSPINLPSGCPFHTRCSEVMPICHEKRPELLWVSDDRMVACHLYGDVEKVGAGETEEAEDDEYA